MEDIKELKGQGESPVSLILAGVHGDEVCGIDAVKSLLPSLSVNKGRVIFAYGNPRAIEKSVRLTEKNLNRMFKPDDALSEEEKASYEYKRAQFLQSYLDQAEVLLDIHASHTPKSQPFIICEPNGFGIAQYLPFDLVVSGFDELEPGGTDSYMNKQGKIGICVECGYLGDPSSTQKAEETILAFLKTRGHLDGNVEVSNQEFIQMDSIYITKTDDFRLSKEFSDFEPVSSGQVIGTDGDTPVVSDEDSIILFARNREAVGEEAFLLGEKKSSQ